MSLKLAIDNGDKNFTNMTKEELISFRQLAYKMPLLERGVFYEKMLQPAVHAFSIEITQPTWLKSEFSDNVWYCVFGKNKKVIDFNVRLEDGRLLTHAQHSKLLYTFKYWLCCQTHPRFCGGTRLSSPAAARKLLYSLHIIDALLLRAEYFQLAEYGLTLLTKDSLISLLKLVCTRVSEGVYEYSTRVSIFLKNKCKQVSDNSMVAAISRYPSIVDVPEEMTLDLSFDELRRARVWLESKGAYRVPESKQKIAGSCNSKIFQKRFYSETLHGLSVQVPLFPELRIKPCDLVNEFRAVPISMKDEGICHEEVHRYIKTIKSLRLVSGDSFVGPELEDIDFAVLKEEIQIRKSGRNRTLPASVAFKGFRDGFEFCYEYIDDILEAVANVIINRNVPQTHNDKNCDFLDAEVVAWSSDKLKSIGVTSWQILDSDNRTRPADYFNQLRNNVGLSELYNVLMGSVQIVVGFIMARRSGELISLKSNCLTPSTDPTLPENQKTEYSLVFDNGKSGEEEEREQLARPIMLPVAKLLWKLNLFREKFSDAKMIEKKAGLFLMFDRRSYQTKGLSREAYNYNLDYFCDYFETKTIDFGKGDVHRYYIRQHQLRRFFALAFFWGSGFDGLDTLRWFLGHTDAEHLWRYISESTPGSVLRGVKAEALIYGINSNKINGIEKLRELLKERFGVEDVLIESLEETLQDYEEDALDGLVHTEPPMSELRRQLEHNTELLLAEGTMDLEPTFCVVRGDNGETLQKVNLVLVVKEINNGE